MYIFCYFFSFNGFGFFFNLNKDARLSELRIATSQHVEAILLKAESTIDSQVEHAMKLMDIDRDGVVS